MSLCVGRAKSGAVLKKIFWACLLWCCAAAIVEACAWGQTAVDGAISGFVVDAGGAALVGAVVQVQNVANGTMDRVTTEGKGEFLVAHLPAGRVSRGGGVCAVCPVDAGAGGGGGGRRDFGGGADAGGGCGDFGDCEGGADFSSCGER